MSVRRDLRPLLERLVELLRARRYPVDNMLLRLLRDYGIECHALGRQTVHTHSTVPAPASSADEITGRYSAVHPHHRLEDPDG